MAEDLMVLEKNGKAYSKLHPKSRYVLKLADGRKDYKKIAKELSLNESKVSYLLNKAVVFGLAERIKAGVYKKKRGALGYIPTKPSKLSLKGKTIKEVVEKFSKKRKLKTNFKGIPYKIVFEGKVEKMAEIYKWLFVTENVLRELIRSVLGKEDGWWEKRIPQGVKTEVQKQKDNYPYDGGKRKDELEYTHLGQLKEIIISKNNWNEFLPYFKKRDKDTFKVFIERAIPLRNSIGHCISLIGDDYKRADMRFKDILNLLK